MRHSFLNGITKRQCLKTLKHWSNDVNCFFMHSDSDSKTVMLMLTENQYLNMHVTNPSKKVRKLKFHRSYLSYYHTSNMVFDIIRKPVYLSLNWYHICNGYEIMESTLQLVLIECQKWNLANHCVLAIVEDSLDDWRMKTIGVSLLCNTNELQDFISDLHSYPAALFTP